MSAAPVLSSVIVVSSGAAAALLCSAVAVAAVVIATHPRYRSFVRAHDLTILSLQWEAGAMPGDAKLAEFEALANDSGATVLIWEADPAAAAQDAIAAIGLEAVVFPPLAVPDYRMSMIDSVSASVDALAAARERARDD